MVLSGLYRSSQRSALGAAIVLMMGMLLGCGGQSETPATAPSAAEPKSAADATPSAAPASTQSGVAPATPVPTDIIPDNPNEPIAPDAEPTGTESIADAPGATTTAPTIKFSSTATPEAKAPPSMFKEGVHYLRLSPTQPTFVSPGQVEVVEAFWYGCPHCFALEPKLEAWRNNSEGARDKGRQSYVVFRRLPAGINDTAVVHARIFYAAEMLGKIEELHPLVFREIQLNANPLNTMDKAKAFFAAHGVSKGDFDKTFAKFEVESKLQNGQLMMRRYRLNSVPSFVVNGKFTTDVAMAGGEPQLFQLINELAAREQGL
jgi:protein dithiol oxidoreductase (disulfide-forming)